MNSTERELLQRYQRERERAERERDDAQRRFVRYDLAVRGLEGVLGDEAPEHAGAQSNGRAPRTVEAVEQMLREAGPGGLTVKALTGALAQRGWLPESKNPPVAVRAAADRLRARSPAFDLVDGRFIYRPARSAGPTENEDHGPLSPVPDPHRGP